jgi:type I restriction enzyme M protein
MLDTDTRRRIDTARDILVGKVPDPKSQVEQITIALIYKFMDDMDAESEEFGGVRKFFAGEFARYGWARLMYAGLGGNEILNLYAEAIAKMPENPGIPLLFRNIFKNAYLPYRDPETLKMFLKVIDEFSYDHSERLGDAFEYLLSVLGSQGDAGQFRTPRHIIDFMVAVVDPQKTETVLDPACGTAGFLISAYKHILNCGLPIADRGLTGNSQIHNPQSQIRNPLTPDERGRLAQNFRGYDISPDMVRLSLVNLYLHGFADPHIFEYDTLTSQDRWNEYADVILANPPFMSPKGGIKPHNRFSVQSKRSEVLFVDYMAEHLTPGGRAGIIVPEGIIFQSQTAYRDLRKMLVDTALVAVVSLPAGVFQPYSGVKTSILILDKALAKRADAIAFFKVENDGFGLGAQRREIDRNDLPQARAEISEYLRHLRAGESVADYQPTLGLIVAKEKVAAHGDYNLSGERYRENGAASSTHPFVALGDVCEIYQPKTITQQDLKEDGAYVVYGANGVIGRYDQFNHEFPEVIVTCRGATCGTVNYSTAKSWITGNAMVFSPKTDVLLKDYLFRILKHSDLSSTISGSAQPQITRQSIAPYQIPLPPLDVQQEIVAEIVGYQKVINGARAVLDNYRPHIPIHPDWPMVELGKICDIKSGGTPSRSEPAYWHGTIPWVGSTVCKDSEVTKAEEFITEDGLNNSAARLFPKDTTLIALVGATIGKTGLLKFESTTNQNIAGLYPKSQEALEPVYLFHAAKQLYPEFLKLGEGKFRMANLSFVREQKIPLPPLATQQAIVAEIEAEQALVAANRELIARFEKKIQATLARVWGADEPALGKRRP